ncbi:hypothetical protein [Clostridium brassicae]|uniref:Phage-Barnase-EndoU-ColicinE5/D-RelE like nuclease 4 domain-containing protein n=1 Tax=Clostridium brassicae TaxID=2999072 RepID=A0ABT4D803_9CLOT|nr:hypothetical protein [Clostridium brassicae]MCY6958427.1 hypothetical protein [Clostridium brassicae]
MFPENKDVGNILKQSYRDNLITVPSCDKHNSKKAHNDEYLMACLSGRVGNNSVAYIHNKTKVKRALERNTSLYKIEKDDVLKIANKSFPIQCVTVDNLRLIQSFEAIARALYYYEKNKIFIGECTMVSDIFIDCNDKRSAYYMKQMIALIEKEQISWETKVKGSNRDVFAYQFSPMDGFKCQTLALTFYKGTKVYVAMSEMDKELKKKTKPQFDFLIDAILGDYQE